MSKDNPKLRIAYTLSNISLLFCFGAAAVFLKNITEGQDAVESDSSTVNIAVNTLAITLSFVGLITTYVIFKEETPLYINSMALARKNSDKPPNYFSKQKVTPLFAAACYLALASAAALAQGFDGLAGFTNSLSKQQNSSGFIESIIITLFCLGVRNWEIGLSIHEHEPTSTIPLSLIANLDAPLLSDSDNFLKLASKQYKKTLLHGSAVLSLLLTASLIAYYYPAAGTTNTHIFSDDNLPSNYNCPNRILTNQYNATAVNISYLETKIVGGRFQQPFINPLYLNQTWIASLDSKATFMVITSKVLMDEVKINKATIVCNTDSACELQLDEPDFNSVALIDTGNCSQAITYNYTSNEAEKSKNLLRGSALKNPLTSTPASWFDTTPEVLEPQGTNQLLHIP